MSFWALASGIIILGAGLGAPELPGMLERAGKLRGLDLSSSLVTQQPRLGATQPMLRAADDILLSPSAAADHWGDFADRAALRTSPPARVWVMEGWPALSPGVSGTAEWHAALDLSRQLTEHSRQSLAPEARTIPVARALAAADTAAAAGRLRGLSSGADLYRASGGLNDRGLYLVTMLMMALLTEASPEGLPAQLTRLWMARDSVVSIALALDLQRLAWEVAQTPAGPEGPAPEVAPPPEGPAPRLDTVQTTAPVSEPGAPAAPHTALSQIPDDGPAIPEAPTGQRPVAQLTPVAPPAGPPPSDAASDADATTDAPPADDSVPPALVQAEAAATALAAPVPSGTASTSVAPQVDSRAPVLMPMAATHFTPRARPAKGLTLTAGGLAPTPGADPSPAEKSRAGLQPDPAASAALAAPLPPPGDVTAPGIAFNLAEVADWSTQQPFLDVMKTARPWIGHREGQWGSFDTAALRAGGWLGADGWPRGLPPEATGLATLVLTDLPSGSGGVAGRYILRYQGSAHLSLDGRASGIRQQPGEISFDYTPGPGGVILTLSAIDPADPPRAMTLVREDRLARLEAGEIFNPDWLQRLRGTRLLRFMDWGRTNGATLSRPEDRPRPSDFTWAEKGVPVEVMLALANTLGTDAWFTLPHLAQDALVRDIAQRVHQGLAPGARAYVEYSNEVWNHIFPQAAWAEAEGRARWGQEWKWVQFYALRAAEVAEIWREVFADAPERLVRVLGTQTGWMGLEVDILDAPLVQAEGRPAPHKAFDVLAVTGYVSGGIGGEAKFALLRDWLDRAQAAAQAEGQQQGLSGAALARHVEDHRFDLAIPLALEEMRDGRHSGNPHDTLDFLFDELLPWQKRAAETRGLGLVMYEGGTHAVGIGALQQEEELTAFLAALNYSPGMGRLYRDLIDRWAKVSDSPFAAFVDVMAPSKYGSWGALRHLEDDNPRWRALAKGAAE